MGRTHAHLKRAEGVLDRLAAHAHRLRVRIETLLRDFEYVFMLPSADAALVASRALRFERTVRAGRRPIAAQHHAVFLARIPISQLLARRAAIDILRRYINKVL